MPILIKGSGGAQKAPTISVNSSGLITATAGKKSVTKQLSSSDDADFIAKNIKSGVNIFGVDGTMVQHSSGLFSDCTSGDGYVEFTMIDYFGEWPSGDNVNIKTAWVNIIIGTKLNNWAKRFIYVTNDLSTSGENGYTELFQLDNGLNAFDCTAIVTKSPGKITFRIESDEAFSGLGSNSSDDLYVYSVRGAYTFSF